MGFRSGVPTTRLLIQGFQASHWQGVEVEIPEAAKGGRTGGMGGIISTLVVNTA